MLAYAIDNIIDLDIGKIDIENISGTNELLAILLDTAYKNLLNSDLETDYHTNELVSDRPYGRLNIEKSYKTGVISQGKIFCDINTEDINSIYNQVIKATFNTLINYNEISSDKIKKKTLGRLLTNLDTLKSVDDIELYPELIDRIGGVPDRYSVIWVVIRMILYMQMAYDKNGKYCLLELNDVNKLSVIFENFGVEFARKEYLKGRVSKPTYYIKDDNGINTRRNMLDMLILNKTNVAIGDYKFYDKTSIIDDTANIREVYDYANSFFDEDKRASKYNSIKCVLIYAYKSEADKAKFKREEVRTLKGNRKCTIYRRSVDLSKSFDEIKKQLIAIFDEMLT